MSWTLSTTALRDVSLSLFYHGSRHALLIMTLRSLAVVLSPLSHSLEIGVTIRLVVTIWGNSVNTHQNDSAAPIEGPSNHRRTNITLPAHRPSHPFTFSVPTRHLTLQATLDADVVEVSESLARVSPDLADYKNPVTGNMASVSDGTMTRLESAVSTLQWIVNFENL